MAHVLFGGGACLGLYLLKRKGSYHDSDEYWKTTNPCFNNDMSGFAALSWASPNMCRCLACNCCGTDVCVALLHERLCRPEWGEAPHVVLLPILLRRVQSGRQRQRRGKQRRPVQLVLRDGMPRSGCGAAMLKCWGV